MSHYSNKDFNKVCFCGMCVHGVPYIVHKITIEVDVSPHMLASEWIVITNARVFIFVY